MSETETAIKLANIILDRPYEDPDCDAAMLSRQFLRSQEALSAAQAEIARLRAMIPELWCANCGTVSATEECHCTRDVADYGLAPAWKAYDRDACEASVEWRKTAEAAQAEIVRLREALEPFANLAEDDPVKLGRVLHISNGAIGKSIDPSMFHRARSALSGQTGESA